MKELKDKVIQLGLERGYIPKTINDNVIGKFEIQYLRMLEETGEAAREIRLKNKEGFEMEYGDVLVLQINCEYIEENFAIETDDLSEQLMKDARRSIANLAYIGEWLFDDLYSSQEVDKRCLQLAYDKILSRGGMLIGEDWFKPSDKEYQEAKLKELEHLFIEFLTDGPGTIGYVGRLKNLYFDLKNLDDSKLDDDSIERIVFLETKVHTMLKAI